MAVAKADLMAHKANNDVESASASVQTIANLEAERANLTTLYQNYVASQRRSTASASKPLTTGHPLQSQCRRSG
jgi:hypothetical protein